MRVLPAIRQRLLRPRVFAFLAGLSIVMALGTCSAGEGRQEYLSDLADRLESCVDIPLLHIADATAQSVRARGVHKVGLLGTRFTMEEDFYRGRLSERFGLDVLVPDAAARDVVHRVIYDELCLGRIEDESRTEFRRIMADLIGHGAEAIILGCTEITLLVDQSDAPVPLFDTTAIHARKAAEWSLLE